MTTVPEIGWISSDEAASDKRTRDAHITAHIYLCGHALLVDTAFGHALKRRVREFAPPSEKAGQLAHG